MRRGSVIAPLILILIGVLFLANNLHPELSVIGLLAQYWPFLLIFWGALRLIEILFWAARNRPLPAAGISGGEWTLIVFLSVFGSGAFFATHREKWPAGINVGLRGIDMFGEPFDYPVPDMSVPAENSKNLRVVIEAFRGNARITGSQTVNGVRVTGRKTIRAMDKSEADRTNSATGWEAVRQGDTIFIRPTGLQPTSSSSVTLVSDLDITVPQNARIDAHGRRGDFDITDIMGDVLIDSDNAGVRVQNIGGNITVDLRASDVVRAIQVKGNIEVRGSGHEIEMEDVTGQVTVAGNFSGDLQFRSVAKPVKFEGGIKARGTEWRVESCPGQVRMSRGNLLMENVQGPVMVRAKSKDVQLAQFTDSLDLQIDRGDVELRPGVAPLPRMTAVTRSGNVELSLPDNSKFALKAIVDKGEIENDFRTLPEVQQENRGATLSGTIGTNSPELTVRSERGTIRVRKAGSADVVSAPKRSFVPPGRPPEPPARPIPVERN